MAHINPIKLEAPLENSDEISFDVAGYKFTATLSVDGLVDYPGTGERFDSGFIVRDQNGDEVCYFDGAEFVASASDNEKIRKENLEAQQEIIDELTDELPDIIQGKLKEIDRQKEVLEAVADSLKSPSGPGM